MKTDETKFYAISDEPAIEISNVCATKSALDEVDKSTKIATNKLTALMDVLNIDQDKIKEKLILMALKNLAEGKESEYDGDLNKDVFELVTGLIKVRDEAWKDIAECKKLNNDLSKQYVRCKTNINKAIDKLENKTYISVKLPYKRRFKYDEVVAIISEQVGERVEIMAEACKLLED